MTHVDDLYEPGDDREPDDGERWAPGVVPVNLDEVEQRLERLVFLAPPVGIMVTRAEIADGDDLDDLRELIGHDVPGLIADLRAARERIAEWEALEKREEWAVTKSRDVPVPPHAYLFPGGDAAIRAADRHGQQAWRRTAVRTPWEPIDSEPPF